jgi:hypothetical protein
VDVQAKIEAQLLNDLSDGPPLVSAFTTIDPGTGQRVVEPETYVLLGTSLRLITRVDSQSTSKLAVTGVSRSSSEAAHERLRADAWDCKLNFVFSPAANGKQAVENLRLGHQLFLEQGDARQRQREEESLFENWSRLLQLRMDHVEASKSYEYDGFDVEENRFVFHTHQRADPTILNECWMVEGTKLSGEVDQADENSVGLYMERRFPATPPPKGRLVIDARATKGQIKRQLHSLQVMRNPRSPRQEVLKRCLIHPADADVSPGEAAVAHWFSEHLDDNKKSVIKAALSASDMFKVEGPPGTGKTTFIAELILQFLDRNPRKRVLLTSQTHIAVDNAIEKVLRFRPELRVTRVGFQEAKVAATVQPHLLSNRLIPWREKTRRESIQFLTQFAQRSGFDSNKVHQGIDIGLILQARRELTLVERREADIENGLQTVREELYAKDDRGEPLANADRSEYLETELGRLREDLNDLRLTRQARAQARREAERDFVSKYPEDKALIRESDAELTVWRDGLIGTSAEAQQICALFELQAEWLQRFTRDDDCKEIILLDSDLIAGTCIGITSGDTEDEGYGLCIVDEASKATLPEALVPMIRSERWVLVGDQRQLPPFVDAILRSPRFLAEKRIDAEVVKETLLSRLDRLQLPSRAQAMLTHQHRMVPAIGNLVSAIFYGGRLESVVDPRRLVPDALGAVLSAPVAWVSTSLEQGRREQSPSGSFFNALEADWAAALLERLSRYYSGANDGERLKSVLKVAVLTGYSAQRNHLIQRLGHLACPLLEVECHTVDSYQGREADVVIFSVTRSNDQGRPGFLAAHERINVALSRARLALWIVGDADFCRDLGHATPLADVRLHIEANPGDCLLQEGLK